MIKAKHLTLLFSLAVGACSTLPEVEKQAESSHAPAAQSGILAETSSVITAANNGDDSQFLMLSQAEEAMRWRLALVDSAQASIDMQYFIWKDDASASLLLEHVFAAADRGVTVRLLVDDMFLSTGGAFTGADLPLASIGHHPNINLRLFNPGKYRDGIMGLAGNFGGSMQTYNRRMHNKLMVVDGHFAILGGRNIGDEYFGLYEGHNFLDLDVLVSGQVLPTAATAFDSYWNSELVYPVGALAQVSDADLAAIREENAAFVDANSELLTIFLEDSQQQSARIINLPNDMHTGVAVYLQDDPVLRGAKEYRLYSMLNDLAQRQGQELTISAPYLIPVSGFLEDISANTEEGTKVNLLTNSLASNDETAAHSHYKKYRAQIMDTGASLYEFRSQPGGQLRDLAEIAPPRAKVIGLHTKAASIDGEVCFIGSLNLDPRSVKENTENGLYIESPALCGELQQLLSLMIAPNNAWRVGRNPQGKLTWTSSEGVVDKQPATSGSQRITDWFFRLLPLESQL